MILQRKWFLAFTALVVISLIVGIGQILADSSSSEPEPAVPNKDIQNSVRNTLNNFLQPFDKLAA